jgi:hypothetical protein
MDTFQAIQSVFVPEQPSPAPIRLASPATAGNALVVVANVEAKDSVLSVTDNAGNTYAPVQNFRWTWDDAGRSFAQEIFYCPEVSGAPNSVTVTTADGGNVEVRISELGGFKADLEITLQARATSEWTVDSAQAIAVAAVAVQASLLTDLSPVVLPQPEPPTKPGPAEGKQ